jgi:polyisoprenoid-binding protein YceI
MSAKSWTIDATHSSLCFVVRHMLVSRVRGIFTRFGGTLALGGADETPSVSVCIEAASIDTLVPKRDAHLRSRDFLDAARHPLICFRSTSLEPLGGGLSLLSGELTLRGVTRPVTLEVEDQGRVHDLEGAERIGFSARATVSRKAFGMTFNHVLDVGGLAVGDQLELLIDVEAVETTGRDAKQAASGSAL